MKAKDIYFNFRIYQHWLQENHLDNDSENITVEDLQKFIEESISEEDYNRLREFCVEAY